MADFNINAVARKVSFTGASGVGPYSFSFEILDDDDVAVYFNETVLTKTTDYSVTINANGTGSVTLVVNVGGNVPATPDSDDLIIIVGARDIERTTDFVTAGDLKASALNEQLDALTIFVQQIAEETARSVKAPVFDPTGITMILPKKADRVNAFLSFDANGDVAAAVPSDDVTTLAEVATDIKILADIEDGTDATDAIQNVAAIAANVTTVAGIAANVTAVANDQADIGTVATDLNGADNIGTVAGSISDINALGPKATQIGLLGTADAIADMNTLGTADVVSDMNTLGTADVVADMNTLATAAIVADMDALADITSEITTVSGDSANIQALAAKTTEIGLLGTADAIADLNTLGTADVVSDMNTLATAAIVADMNTLADRAADIATLADIEDGTVATTAISGLAAIETEILALYAELASIATKVSTTGDTMTGDLIINTTGALTLPVGTQAQRPTPAKGMFRFNDDEDQFEGYDGAAWGAVGGGNTAVVGWENQITVAENYTITTGNNMVSAGPVTIDTGFAVTVPTGSRWVVV